jgi:phosphoglycolate phosphatase-like HAD superfamily hydrolase
MFAEMRAALGISRSQDILDHIYSLPTPEQQHQAMELIRNIERTAYVYLRIPTRPYKHTPMSEKQKSGKQKLTRTNSMASQVAQPGLVQLMTYLDSRGVRKGICTRNFDAPVNNLLTKFLAGSVFAPVVTRDFRPPKPDPAGILYIARSWGLVRRSTGEAGVPLSQQQTGEEEEAAEASRRRPAESADVDDELVPTERGEEVADASALIMVGDSIDDMTAGRRAGARTVLLVNDVNRHLADHEHTDLVISRLDELIDVLENGLL